MIESEPSEDHPRRLPAVDDPGVGQISSAREPAAYSRRPPSRALFGRSRECNVLDRLLEEARARRGGALVMRGEPGVGKSALLEYLVERASGCQVAMVAGVESEMELAFAGVHQLCAPVLDR